MAIVHSDDLTMTARYGNIIISGDIDCFAMYAPKWRVWLNDINCTAHYSTPSAFPSMENEYTETGELIPPPTTTAEEKAQPFGVAVSINGESVPNTDVKNVWIRWPLNGPVSGGCVFRNWEGIYTTNTLPDETNYISITFQSVGGTITFSPMIIKERDGGWEVTVSCIDGLSNILYNPVTLDEYVAREGLTRVDGFTYTADGLTLGTDSPAFRILVNFEESSGTYSGKTLTVSSEILDINIPVSLEAPYYAKWVIKNMLGKLKDASKIQVSLNFSDFLIYENIPVWKTAPIEILNTIFESIPGEWYIQPTSNFFKLVVNKINTTHPEQTAFSLNEDLYNSPPSIHYTTTKGFNTINVIRPAIREAAVYSWQEIADTSLEEVIIDFGGQYAIKDTVECITTGEVADGGYAEITSYTGIQTRGGIVVCTGVTVAVTVNKEHDFQGQTIETPYSMVGYKVIWETYQGARTPVENTISTDYAGYAPLTDTQWANYLEILKEGINVEVTTASSDTEIIRADNNITNGMIASVATAIEVAREQIRLSNIKHTFSCSIVPAFGFDIRPGRWGDVIYNVLSIDDKRKIKEIYISCAEQKFDLTFLEGVAV